MAKLTNEEIERETVRIAKSHGCDRGTFTVCWPEFERGATCRCKQDAIASLSEAGRTALASEGGGR